jgi:hypothetical protein
MNRKVISSLILFLFISSLFQAQSSTDLLLKLKSIKEIAEIKPTSIGSSFTEGYEIFITQPLDHKNPNAQTFTQRIFLSHVDYEKPVVLITEGYSANYNYKSELSQILGANQIIVEHRYFGKSVPAPLDWKYLDIEQSAGDHHSIVQIFKTIYPGKWINTGISKGGQTTLYHRKFYPNDVDVSVPYVAPINVSQEDPRIYMFLNSVGTEECRNKIKEFQREFLSRRDEILPMMMLDAEKNNKRFFFDFETLFEYWVLEYSFSFWQWGQKCEDIPSTTAAAKELFDYMKKANTYEYFTEETMKGFGSFFVQAYNEIGYYGYDLTDFKDLLKEVKDGSNIVLVPEGAEINYNCKPIQDVNTWLQKKGNNIIYIYGGNDTWTATAVQLTGETNAIKMVKKNGSHTTRIASFEGEEKELIYSTLEKWLNLKIER